MSCAVLLGMILYLIGINFRRFLAYNELVVVVVVVVVLVVRRVVVQEKKINIVGGDTIDYCQKNSSYVHMS
jgi:hypothetical protein